MDSPFWIEELSILNINTEDKPTDKIDFLHPGRSSKLFTEGNEVGYFGEIHPKLISNKKALKQMYLFSLKLKNIFLLPHLGSATKRTRWDMAYRATRNLEQFFSDNKPQDQVN